MSCSTFSLVVFIAIVSVAITSEEQQQIEESEDATTKPCTSPQMDVPTTTAKRTPTEGHTTTAKKTSTEGLTTTAKSTPTEGHTTTAKSTPTEGHTTTAKSTPTEGHTTTAKKTSTEGLTTTAKSTSTEGHTTTAKTNCKTYSLAFQKECQLLKSSFYYDGSCFVKRLQYRKYDEAKKLCKDMSPNFPKGHLAHVKSQSLIDIMEKKFWLGDKKQTHSRYIGLRQKDKEEEPAGHWFWIDEEGNMTESADEILKPLWNKDQPNDKENKEECVIIYRNKLYDIDCSFHYKFICQYHEPKE